MAPETYAGGSREDRRIILPSCFTPIGDADEAVQHLTERVIGATKGGAQALAGGPIPISYPQIRKWMGDGSLPGLANILRLTFLAGPKDPFRLDLRDTLSGMFDPTPEQIAAAVEKKLGKTAGAAVRDAFREVAPGRWGR